MKFLNLGLLTLSSLFAASSAAPAPQSSLVPTLPIHVKQPGVEVEIELNSRADSVVRSKLNTTLVEVKKHTSKINSTVETVGKTISNEDKLGIIESVQSEVGIIVGLISTLAGEVVELVGGTLEKVEQDELLKLVLELVFEIIYTLKNAIAILHISIFELLGNLIFSLLTAIGHLLAILNMIVDGLLKLVFNALGDVVGTLQAVLSGLLPLVLDIVNGVFGKVGNLLPPLF
ncbi:Nn.00g025640.m01.CDS01 [Neocucurbitaria sp. VM-36]